MIFLELGACLRFALYIAPAQLLTRTARLSLSLPPHILDVALYLTCVLMAVGTSAPFPVPSFST